MSDDEKYTSKTQAEDRGNNVVRCMRDPYTVYIGRESAYAGVNGPTGSRGEKRSKWQNPFKIGRDGDRDEVLAKYREHVLSRQDLLQALPELNGQTLGCWCHPEPCHGDVLLALANEHTTSAQAGTDRRTT